MINLLTEAQDEMAAHGLTPDDIVFIGSEKSGHECTWEEFRTLANRTYDDGFGTAEVALDLVIVFRDGSQMRRTEYDGSEGWEMIRPFVRPDKSHPIAVLFGYGYGGLAGMNPPTP